MLQEDEPHDYVIATGESHSVREFLGLAAARLELDWEAFTEIDPRYFRPAEVETLLGDPGKAKSKLGWAPEITAHQMCVEMVAEDLKAAQRLALLRAHGHDVSVTREVG